MVGDQTARYVELALEAKADGQSVDLDDLCSEHPELIPAVREALQLDDVLDLQKPADPLLGETLDGRYALDACIGAGAMGVVYRAVDRSLNREVAVKVLQQGIFGSEQRHERFAREARVLASLHHPNIVAVHDHGRSSGGLHYIVTELLIGVPLSAILQQAELEASESEIEYPSGSWMRERFGIDVVSDYIPQVISWCQQLAQALAAAHRAGVTHRDVKPSNVFIAASGDAVLLDFGIAAQAGDEALTAAGSTIGSPWYMAPEQSRDASSATELVDVYGLCATLYHLATFRPPYEGDYATVLARLQTSDPVPPGHLRKELSRDLCAVIEKGMERNPAHRYQSIDDLDSDLRALRAQMPVRARPISKAERVVRRIRRRPGPALAVLGVLIAVIVTIAATSAWRESEVLRQREQDVRYGELLAAVPPSLGIEGSPATRPELDDAEREHHIQHLTRILDLRPSDAYSLLLRSALYQDRGDHAASAADVRRLLDFGDTDFLRELADRYDNVDQSTRGILAVNLEQLPDPESERDIFVAAFHLARLKKSARADALLRRAPLFAPARYLRLSTAYHVAENSEQLRLVIDEALDLERVFGHPAARTSYWAGSALLALAEVDTAMQHLDSAVKLSPDSYGPNFNLGLCLRLSHRWDEAAEFIRRAQQLRPHNHNAAVQLAQIAAEQGDFEGALEIAAAMPETGPMIESGHRAFVMGYVEALQADVLAAQGQAADATAAARRAEEHYVASLETLPPESAQRAKLASELQILRDALGGDSSAYLYSLTTRLCLDPTNPTYLRAVAASLRQTQVDRKLRRRLSVFLERLAGQMRRPSKDK